MGRDSEEFNAVTVGINYLATGYLMLRREIGMVYFDSDIKDASNNGGIDALGRRDSTVFGFDAIWSY